MKKKEEIKPFILTKEWIAETIFLNLDKEKFPAYTHISIASIFLGAKKIIEGLEKEKIIELNSLAKEYLDKLFR